MRTAVQAKSAVQSLPAQTQITLDSPLVRSQIERAQKPRRLRTPAVYAAPLLGVLLLLTAPFRSFAYLGPQSAAPSQAPPSAQPVHKPSHPHARPSAAHPADQLVTPVAPAPIQPELPKWPVNEKADPASVVWDSHGLRIEATNSSLEQILTDVSADTGATVEGLDNDQRIFGTFGPGTARDVLGQLLEGSGYNFLMIGDQGQGTPRQIVLSVRSTGSSPQGAKPPSPNDEDEVDEQPQPQPPQEGFPNRAGFPPRSMQQRMQQQQQMQQQQGQQPGEPPNQQPGQPPSTPPN